MSEHHFGPYRGHLSVALIERIEAEFPEVSVVNYREPGDGGARRGWMCCPNRGEPFDSATARAALTYARSIARGEDLAVLGGEP